MTYPRYKGGVKVEDSEPSFCLSKGGDRNKLPIFVHYNGINHYNTFVPMQYPSASTAPKAQPKGIAGPGGAFGHVYGDMMGGAPMASAPSASKKAVSPARKPMAPSNTKPKTTITKPAVKK